MSIRTHRTKFTLPDDPRFRSKVLQWAWQQEYMAALEPNGLDFPHGAFPAIVAVGAVHIPPFPGRNLFQLKNFHEETGDWLFGHFSYDLKNQLEELQSDHSDLVGFPLIHFFQPAHLLFFRKQEIEIESIHSPDKIMHDILSTEIPPKSIQRFQRPEEETSREKYLATVQKLKEHILEGDIYEINYCIQYALVNPGISPVLLYEKLISRSPTPFASLYRTGDQYLVSASPERFLKKSGNKLISQPIKGTVRRSKNRREDSILRSSLIQSEKERAENMMIVDLVRNDLARSCLPGTVKVEELFGIYSFSYLHQMISTISGEMEFPDQFHRALAHAFPMGSMTGAPKIKVMQLAEKYETFKRGIYSGSVGYIDPKGDFDFNVIIRSLYGNLSSGKLGFAVGSAITADSNPEDEYKECQLKARAILAILREEDDL